MRCAPAKKKKKKKKKVLVLKTVSAESLARKGFEWPLEVGAVIEAPDWKPEPVCGGGMHGLLWGAGDVGLVSRAPDAKGLVLEVDEDSTVDLDGKVKFPRCRVVFVGTLTEAATWLAKETGRVVHFAHVTAGDGGTATTGDYGTATAGDYGTATAGHRGTATAGHRGTATAGDDGTATAGDGGTATAGDYGTATAGYYGTATAGDDGTATAGDDGTATTGDYGTATTGHRGTATAGDQGQIRIEFFDGDRQRLAVGYVGEDGIEADVPYVVSNGRLVRK